MRNHGMSASRTRKCLSGSHGRLQAGVVHCKMRRVWQEAPQGLEPSFVVQHHVVDLASSVLVWLGEARQDHYRS